MDNAPFTVIQADGIEQVEATVDAHDATVRLSAAAVEQSLGWQRKTEGLCRDDVCIPARRLGGVEGDDGLIELSALAALLGRPLAIDIEARAVYTNNPPCGAMRGFGVNQVVLAGMAANLCVEGHLRELVEQGFEVAVVKDATAGPRLPEGDGYLAALVNFRFLASAVWTTAEAVALFAGGDR